MDGREYLLVDDKARVNIAVSVLREVTHNNEHISNEDRRAIMDKLTNWALSMIDAVDEALVDEEATND